MTTNHDALREALELGLDYAREALALHDQKYQHHPSTEAERALIAGHVEQIEQALAASKPGQQAKEPEVVQYQYQDKDGTWHNFNNQKHYEDTVAVGGWPIRGLIALQSHHEVLARYAQRNVVITQMLEREQEALAAKDAALDVALEALEFYAESSHFTMHDPDAWDTVSGEPQNFYEDENNTATVEDGSIAKAAITKVKEARG